MVIKAETAIKAPYARTPEWQLADIRALLAIGPEADVVEEVRKLQARADNYWMQLRDARRMLEPCFRMLKKSVKE